MKRFKKFFEKAWLIALFVVVLSGISIAAYNSPWVRTQALYLNDVLVTSTAAELNMVDGLTGAVLTTTSTSVLTNKSIDGDDNTLADIAYSSIKSTSRSGSDVKLVTGTAGTSTYTAQWNVDGDLVDGYALIDDDTMGTASATNIASAESVKAYVDDSVLPKIYLTGEIADISAAASSWVTSPVAGDITRIYTVIEGAITVGDATITFEIATVAVTDGTITIANVGSAAGIVDTCTPSAARTVTAGQAIEIITDGGSTDAAKATVVIEITPSATNQKKYVIGEIADISTGASSWTVAPIAGTISKIYTVIDGAIITVDAGISFELGGTAITDGGITVDFASSAAGIVDSSNPSALNVVAAGDAIEIITNGLSTNAVKAVVVFEITPS